MAETLETTTRNPIRALTPRQLRILASLAQGKTIAETAREFGITRQSVHKSVSNLRGHAPELMDEFGLTEAALIQTYLLPALNAEQTEFAKFQGAITDQRNTVAWGPRLQALDIAAKLRGMYHDETKVIMPNIAIAIEVIGS